MDFLLKLKALQEYFLTHKTYFLEYAKEVSKFSNKPTLERIPLRKENVVIKYSGSIKKILNGKTNNTKELYGNFRSRPISSYCPRSFPNNLHFVNSLWAKK